MSMLKATVLMMASATLGFAQNYCSLAIHVVDPNGNPVSGVAVAVEEPYTARVKERGITKEGQARFCSLGIVPVTVSVGREDCSQAVVQKVPLAWNQTRILTVTYDHALCLSLGVDVPHTGICQILFRFVDEYGSLVPGVRLDPPIGRSPPLRSDDAGRAMRLATVFGPLRRFNLAHPKLLIL